MDFTTEIKKHEKGFYVLSQRHVRAFLFEGKDFNILVDTCFGGDISQAVKGISEKPVKVIFTHCDRDHIGGESLFEDKYIHPAEYSCCLEKNGFMIDAKPLWEGDIIDNGDFKFEIIHIPGHTPGSIALLERDKHLLISGDSVQTGSIYMFGAGRSLQAFKASMGKLIGIKDSFDMAISSHNDLKILPEKLYELESLADDILKGNIPEAKSAPSQMPAEVKIYGKNNVSFFLYEIKN